MKEIEEKYLALDAEIKTLKAKYTEALVTSENRAHNIERLIAEVKQHQSTIEQLNRRLALFTRSPLWRETPDAASGEGEAIILRENQ